MHLYIITTIPNTVTVFLFQDGKQMARDTKTGGYAISEDLLSCIDAVLKDARVSPLEVTGIAVASGAGSFTASRIALTAANTFGYVHAIPVVAVTVTVDFDETSFIADGEAALAKETTFHVQAVSYSGEPNITLKKNR